MPQTVSVFQACVGEWFGALHPSLLAHARSGVATAMQSGAIADGHALECGDAIVLVLSHDQGEGSEAMHRLAWDVLAAGAEIARELGLHAAGRDLIAEAFGGNLTGLGPAVAELELSERPAEPVVVFAGGAGCNLALYRAFADPLHTRGLVTAPAMHDGFAFEVHDLLGQRKAVLTTPEEAYDLLALAEYDTRFAIKRVVTRATAEVAAVASTPGVWAGLPSAAPIAVVRCELGFPSAAEVVRAFGSEVGLAVAFNLVDGALGTPRELGRRPESGLSFDRLWLTGPSPGLGTNGPEADRGAVPGVSEKLAGRWVDM